MISQKSTDLLNDYINNGNSPGPFITYLLCNDVFSAISMGCTDLHSEILDITIYILNNCPTASWGCKAKVGLWMDKKRTEYGCVKQVDIEELISE